MQKIYHGKPYINSLNARSDALLRSQRMWLLMSWVQRLKICPSITVSWVKCYPNFSRAEWNRFSLQNFTFLCRI